MDQTLSPASCSEDEIFFGEISDKEVLKGRISEELKLFPIHAGIYRKEDAEKYKASLQPECDQSGMEEFNDKINASSKKESIGDDSESTSSMLSTSVEGDGVLDGSMSSYLTCKTSRDLSRHASEPLETTELYSVKSHMTGIGSLSSDTEGDVSSAFSSSTRGAPEKSFNSDDPNSDAEDDKSGLDESDLSVDMNNTAEEYKLFCKYGPEYDNPKVRRKIDAERAKGIEVDPLKYFQVDEEMLQYMKLAKQYDEGNTGEKEPCNNEEAQQSEEEDRLSDEEVVFREEAFHASGSCDKLRKRGSASPNCSSTSCVQGLFQSSQLECDRHWASTHNTVEGQESKSSSFSEEQLDNSDRSISGVANLSSSSDKENSVDLAEAVEMQKASLGSAHYYDALEFKKEVRESKEGYDGSSSYRLPTPIKCTTSNSRAVLKSSPFKTPLPKSGATKPVVGASPSKGITRSPSFNRKPFTPITPQNLEGKPKLPYYLQNIESPVAKYIHDSPAPPLIRTNEPMLRLKGKYKKTTPEPCPTKEKLPVEVATPDLNVIVTAEEDSSKAKTGSKLQFLTNTLSPRVYKHLGRQKGHLGDILAATGGKTNIPVNSSQLDNTVEVSVLQEIKK